MEVVPVVGPVISSEFHLVLLAGSEGQICVLVVGRRVDVPSDQLSLQLRILRQPVLVDFVDSAVKATVDLVLAVLFHVQIVYCEQIVFEYLDYFCKGFTRKLQITGLIELRYKFKVRSIQFIIVVLRHIVLLSYSLIGFVTQFTSL